MVSKIKKSKKDYINSEKYTLILLLSGYILGICIGCFFVFSNTENADFTRNIIGNNNIKIFGYFISAIILKYSGILSGAICTLPIFLGIQNSAYYCNYILSSKDKIIYTTILTMLKDTSIAILLVLYLIIIVSQISNKKYNLKKDLKYFSVYITGALTILIFENILKTFIF